MQVYSGCSFEMHVEGSEDHRVGLTEKLIPTVVATEDAAEPTEALDLAGPFRVFPN